MGVGMNWDQYLTALQAGGPELAALVDQARSGADGGSLTTTRLLHDPDEMARLAERIQDACEGSGTTLFSGVRAAEHLGRQQRDRYGRLAASGVKPVLYGVGVPDHLPPGVTWVEVPARSTALENQWFVVAEAPEPVALLSFVISPQPEAIRPGRGGRDQAFAAFVSRDPRLVDAIVRILRTVADGYGVNL
jgi:hypothetical protein